MIVGSRKPFDEITSTIEGYKNILVLGCGTCVAVCMAGGEKEAAILAEELRIHFKKENKDVKISEMTILRQCDEEYFATVRENVSQYDLVISMACGVGVQYAAELFDGVRVVPALNTTLAGYTKQEGMWLENCSLCGDCVLAQTGGICPVTICPKGLLNGPCGGTNDGKCEVDKEKDCAWTLIYRRLEKLGLLDNIREIFPPKKHGSQLKPRKTVHEAYQEGEKENG